MAPIILIGTNAPLLEGIAQTLGAAGHRTTLATSASEVAQRPADEAPLVLIVERALALRDPEAAAELLRLPLAPGGAVLLFRPGGETVASEDPPAVESPLPVALRRSTLAELTLPLERHRLVALVHSVEDRVLRSGRGAHRVTPPENRVV